jgi:hypothetical protein
VAQVDRGAPRAGAVSRGSLRGPDRRAAFDPEQSCRRFVPMDRESIRLDRVRSLDPSQIEQFVRRGFVKLANAFRREVAEEARAILCATRDVTPTGR